MGINIKRLVLGPRLQTKDLVHQAISKPIGLAVFASDALSSTAYATEEILVILSLAAGAAWIGKGADTFGLALPIAIAIAVLLAIVTISYRQTIYAYPNGGGAYIVARDNLGELPAQIAGAALMTDYVLTVAVSISSGVAQIASAFPDLIPYRAPIAVAMIFMMTVINLRGVKESGRIFAVPTYFFLVSMFLMLGVGFVRLLSGSLGTVTEVESLHHEALQGVTLFLLLRAFSSGSTALTGIEAISNGITAFKEPRSHNAAVTLMWMSSILITLFLGITFLATQVEALPSHEETVISQLARTIYGGENIFYLLTLVGTTSILIMAANTSYADFPRLAALSAGDGFLPRQLTYRGGRLVFSWGIALLAAAASILVFITDARVTALIPLYAVGVFLSFTLSQSGMVIHSYKIGQLKPGEVKKGLETNLEYDPNWRIHMAISGIGAVCTFVVMVIFAVTKFTHGAWFIVLLIPTLVFIFFRIHNHYKYVAESLRLPQREIPLDPKPRPMRTLVLVDDVHNETIRLVNFARALGHPWVALHVGVNPLKAERTQERWQKQVYDRIRQEIVSEIREISDQIQQEMVGQPQEEIDAKIKEETENIGKLVVLSSPYRQLTKPVQDYIRQLREEEPDCFVHVVMGHLVMDTFWEQALHQNSSYIFNLALSQMENVTVTVVPYQIHHDNGNGKKNKNGSDV
jgi:amino acid transporter